MLRDIQDGVPIADDTPGDLLDQHLIAGDDLSDRTIRGILIVVAEAGEELGLVVRRGGGADRHRS